MGTTNPLPSTHSSPSSSAPWDVFLSFYGKDTRNSFTAHLYSALDQAAIRTYRDDPELKKGEEISAGLLKAIQESKTCIVVLSQNYAFSRWCLDELVAILGCRKTKGLVIFPVFYHVSPTDIRGQKGSFREALELQSTRYSEDNIQKWRAALTEIANKSGYHIEADGNMSEPDIIQDIVKNVLPLVSTKSLPLEEKLVGIDSVVEEIYEKLSMHAKDVRAIGICGMGGIGKTTIAKAFYNKFHPNFDNSCFAENVKETLQGPHGLLSLLKQLVVQLQRRKNPDVVDVESAIRMLNDIFYSEKVLIVLDDVDKSCNLESLIQSCNQFSPQSRIILTTRDIKLLRQLQIEAYMVNKLDENESLDLFMYHAFRRTIPSEDFKELSVKFVEYAAGLPLALKVLGSSLRQEELPFWKSKLEKIKEIPENGIHGILKLSYDELDDSSVKAIFLDIVFFFLGNREADKKDVVRVFEYCGYYPENGIANLVDKCLLTVKENTFKMHDLIRDMGRKVIREESNEPGRNKRLLCQGNVFELFNNQEGTDKIVSLILDLTMCTRKHLSAKIFERMPNLRLLEIISGPQPHDFKGSFKNSFQQLRCIRWHNCPWTCFPSSFCPEKLVFLDMPFNSFTKLWKGQKSLATLKSINISSSKSLKTTPDFTRVKMLEKLSISCCGNLVKVRQSIVMLNNLGHLNFCDCHNLKRLPGQLGDMKGLKILDVSYTAIEQLPETICKLSKLEVLRLAGCKKPIKLPEQIGSLVSLMQLNARYSAIGQLPDSFVGLTNLVELDLESCTNLRNLPNNFWKLSSLEVLDLRDCENLEHLPENLGKIKCLKELHASRTAIEELPDSIGQISSLVTLNFRGCEKLRNMPHGIWNLTSLGDLKQRQPKSLQNLPSQVKHLGTLVRLSLRCNIRYWLPLLLCFSRLITLNLTDEGECLSSIEHLSFSELSCLRSLTLVNCTSLGPSFPELPLNLRRLSLENYASLEQLPDLSSFIYLDDLFISKCNSLQSIPLLPPRLTWLEIHDCTSLRDVTDLATFKNLSILRITNCSNLKIIVDESFFKVPKRCLYDAFVLPTAEVPDWLSYKRCGRKVSFDVPPMFLSDNFLCTLIWIVYRSKRCKRFWMNVVITNKTDGTKHTPTIHLHTVGAVGSLVQCIQIDENMVKYSSGDSIKISVEILKSSNGSHRDTKIEQCGIHLICR